MFYTLKCQSNYIYNCMNIDKPSYKDELNDFLFMFKLLHHNEGPSSFISPSFMMATLHEYIKSCLVTARKRPKYVSIHHHTGNCTTLYKLYLGKGLFFEMGFYRETRSTFKQYAKGDTSVKTSQIFPVFQLYTIYRKEKIQLVSLTDNIRAKLSFLPDVPPPLKHFAETKLQERFSFYQAQIQHYYQANGISDRGNIMPDADIQLIKRRKQAFAKYYAKDGGM